MGRVELVHQELQLIDAGLVGRRGSVEGQENAEDDEDAKRRQRRQRELRRAAKFGSDGFDFDVGAVAASARDRVVEECEREDLEEDQRTWTRRFEPSGRRLDPGKLF